MRNFLTVGLVVLIALGVGRPLAATAQDAPEKAASRPQGTFLWESATRVAVDHVSDGREAWRSWVLSVKREVGAGTVMGQLTRQSRFGVTDVGGRLDAWHTLWANAWGHVQVGLGPGAQVYPRGTVQADVTQSVGTWELAGQYTWRTYEVDETHAVRPQVAHYVGAWYLRGFATIIPREGPWAATGGLGARRFLGASTSYVDVEAGMGRSVEFVRANSDLLTERTVFASVRAQYFFSDRMGASIGVRYSDDGFFQRGGGTMGLLARW